VTLRGNKPDQPRSTDEWERAWRRHWQKTGFTPYELNLSELKATHRERIFLMQPRTFDRERARLKRLMKEFEQGFRRLHKLGPRSRSSVRPDSSRVIRTMNWAVESAESLPRLV